MLSSRKAAARTLLIASMLPGAGCAGSSQALLNAPSASAPLHARQASYQALRIERVLGRGHDGGWANYGNPREAQLGDNRIVSDPRRLRALVPAQSGTALAIASYTRKRKVGIAMKIARLTLSIAGVSLGLTALVAPGSDTRKRGLWISASACSLSSLIVALLESGQWERANRASRSIWTRYNEDLASRLALEPEELPAPSPQGTDVTLPRATLPRIARARRTTPVLHPLRPPRP